jgi:hypothetical protein
MTTVTAYPPRFPQAAPRARIPYSTIFMLLAATIIIGATAIFSIPAAAIVYVPFYLVLCWIRPWR